MNEHQQTNIADNLFANQGNQYITIQERIRKFFEEGKSQLKSNLYPRALELFEESLSTADEAGDITADPKLSGRAARAHTYAAIALLGHNPPEYKTLDEIDRIITHLRHAIEYGPAGPAYNQAVVLWAIVREDFYEQDGIRPPDPPAQMQAVGVPTESIEALDSAQLELLVQHLAEAHGDTWAEFARVARGRGYHVSAGPLVAVEEHQVDSARAEKVRKYFMPVPNPVSNVSLIAFSTAMVVPEGQGSRRAQAPLWGARRLARW